MTITLEIAPEMKQELEDQAARRGRALEELTKQSLTRTLIEGLKDRPVPQSLAEVEPRRPPPGKRRWRWSPGNLKLRKRKRNRLRP